MMVRVLLSLSFVVVLIGAFPALAHEGHDHEAGIVVVDIEGVLDQRTIDFVSATVRKREAALLVFRIDSPGIASGEIGPLLDLVQASATPIVTWIGPQGAQAYGGALQLAAATDYLGAAPGTNIGFAQPVVAGEAPSGFLVDAPGLESLARIRVQISQESGLPAFVDATSPSIGQFIASLNGLEIDGFFLETAEQISLADGTIATVLSEEVHFLKPGLITRILRLSIRPEAAFFFLVLGLALAAFEFYAVGIGVTAAVASLSLLLSAYGLGTLPVRWWAVMASVVGVLLYNWDFQRSQLGWRSLLGTTGLVMGGLMFTDADPQFGPRWWTVILIVLGIGLFYVFAMTTVVRSRFSTQTIGREYLVGREGVAESSFDPDGFVAVDGASWRGTAHRAAGIESGDNVTVLAVKGIVLEVEPVGLSSEAGDPG